MSAYNRAKQAIKQATAPRGTGAKEKIMSKILTRLYATRLILAKKARITGLVYDREKDVTYMAIDRLDAQRVDHYKIGDGDLRDEPAPSPPGAR